MVGVQTGLQALGKTAFAATFGAFLTRAADQIRMGAISRADSAVRLARRCVDR
jgi:transketolase